MSAADKSDPEDPDSLRSRPAFRARVIDRLRGFLPAKKTQPDHANGRLREALEGLIEDEADTLPSAVASHERRLISNILQLRDLSVVDIMVPRADIVAVDINVSWEGLHRLMAEKPHSRLPVFKGDLDNIVGVIHMKDLVAHIDSTKPFDIRETMREALVVSPSMRVMDLLLQMRQSRVHIAFVVDEFGGIDGLITINDLIESIVGEIEDEFELDITPQLIERPDGSLIADARFPVKEFEKRYGSFLTPDEEEEEPDTLGGLVSYVAGHVPTRGEVVRHDSGVEFVVLEADPRRIIRLRLRNLPEKRETDGEE